ncbi:MAG: hypothetical protein IPP72_10700 [Chitinophagaceae bacterium]|nr:hypothetical protein [Chitinophagaceae bacterium]
MRNITIALLLLLPVVLLAQPSLTRMQLKLQMQGPVSQTGIDFKMISASQAGILFTGTLNLPETQARQWVEEQLEIRNDADAFRPDNNVANTGSMEVKKLHQYYKGIKVEHGVVNMTSKAGKIVMMQLEFYSIGNNFNIRPSLTENEALQKAVAFTGAEKYDWADAADAVSAANAPHGELVIIKDYETEGAVCLAYKFEIYALYPSGGAYVYVNAWDGRILLNDPQIKHIGNNTTRGEGQVLQHGNEKKTDANQKEYSGTSQPEPATVTEINLRKAAEENTSVSYANIQGSAATKFNGTQFIYTDNNSGVAGKPYRLRGSRNNMNIETYNFQGFQYNNAIDYYVQAIDFVDNDNTWTAAEFNNPAWDDAALGVQFSMQIVSDYWKLVHGRNSWDNANATIKSYVHVYELKKSFQQPGCIQFFFSEKCILVQGQDDLWRR